MPIRLPDPLHASHCPLCGGDNACSVADGKVASNCWCMHAYIASTQLARIPLEERGRRCICQACARSSATAP